MKIYRSGRVVREHLEKLSTDPPDIRLYAEQRAKELQIQKLGSPVAGVSFDSGQFEVFYFGPAPKPLQDMVRSLLDSALAEVRAIERRRALANENLPFIEDEDWVELSVEELKDLHFEA